MDSLFFPFLFVFFPFIFFIFSIFSLFHFSIFFHFFIFSFFSFSPPLRSPHPKTSLFPAKNLNFKARFWVGEEERKKKEERRTRRQKQVPFHNRTHRNFLFFACVETPHSHPDGIGTSRLRLGRPPSPARSHGERTLAATTSEISPRKTLRTPPPTHGNGAAHAASPWPSRTPGPMHFGCPVSWPLPPGPRDHHCCLAAAVRVRIAHDTWTKILTNDGRLRRQRSLVIKPTYMQGRTAQGLRRVPARTLQRNRGMHLWALTHTRWAEKKRQTTQSTSTTGQLRNAWCQSTRTLSKS